MTLNELRQKYLDYMEKKGHVIVPTCSLVPENDPTTLFTGSGMQPMIPYLLGKKHPQGNRVSNSQRCFRAEDIEEVGDNRHTTFFEMLGNWSFGDYFRKEQLDWISKFLFDELEIEPNNLYVTCFIGDEENNLPRDIEAAELWKKIFEERNIVAGIADLGSEEQASKKGIKEGERIFYYSTKNWWSRSGAPNKMPIGEPGGPDSEMFYKFSDIEHDPVYGEHCHPNCDCGRFMEIGNNVFMTFKKVAEGKFEELPNKNIDFGGGLERITAAANDNSDVFAKTPFSTFFSDINQKLKDSGSSELGEYKKLSKENKFAFRVFADHVRAATFMIADGVIPSNTEQGYFVRRLLRRAIRYQDILYPENEILTTTIESVVKEYRDAYPFIEEKGYEIIKTILSEETTFRKTLKKGLKEFEKLSSSNISGHDAFILFSTYGFPIELTVEMAKNKNIKVDTDGFREQMKKHQALSRAGAEQKFKGGLGDTSQMSVKYHTATHLLHKALREVLGTHVEQRGSNITPERLRFDFSHSQKMTEEEKTKVENLVNEKIKENLPVNNIILPKKEAEEIGALHFFGEKYGDQVSVYYIGESLASAYSKEFCGGPHVKNTKELGHFKIKQEEAVSAGIRRIKAILE